MPFMCNSHNYGVNKADTRAALASVLSSGLVAPTNGTGVFAALQAGGGCGLLDRLIADDYRRTEYVTLPLDKRATAIPGCRLL